MRTFHICFEGMPGSGKTTQAKILTEKINNFGISAQYVKSPNGTNFGKIITNAILTESPSDLSEIFAFLSCYYQLTREKIIPLLQNDICVISDKGLGASYAHALYKYKGIMEKNLFDCIIKSMGHNNALFPDLTFFLNIPTTEGFKRKGKCRNLSRMDISNDLNIQEAESYSEISKIFSNWIIVDATKNTETVSSVIWLIVKNFIESFVKKY